MNVGSRQDGVANIQAFILFLISDLHTPYVYIISAICSTGSYCIPKVREGLDLDSLDLTHKDLGDQPHARLQSLRLKKYY